MLIQPEVIENLLAGDCTDRCQVTSRLIAPMARTRKILKSLDLALDEVWGISLTVVPDPLMRGGHYQTTRREVVSCPDGIWRVQETLEDHVVTYWQAAIWRRYEVIVSGLPRALAEFYRIAESHYERS